MDRLRDRHEQRTKHRLASEPDGQARRRCDQSLRPWGLALANERLLGVKCVETAIEVLGAQSPALQHQQDQAPTEVAKPGRPGSASAQ
jgi:hypothetical protein